MSLSDADIQHHLFALTFEGRLHAAPLDQPLRRVLDAGCGTGLWAIDFGTLPSWLKRTNVNVLTSV